MIGCRCLEELGQVATVSWDTYAKKKKKKSKQNANSVLTSSKNKLLPKISSPLESKTQRVKTSDGKPKFKCAASALCHWNKLLEEISEGPFNVYCFHRYDCVVDWRCANALHGFSVFCCSKCVAKTPTSLLSKHLHISQKDTVSITAHQQWQNCSYSLFEGLLAVLLRQNFKSCILCRMYRIPTLVLARFRC